MKIAVSLKSREAATSRGIVTFLSSPLRVLLPPLPGVAAPKDKTSPPQQAPNREEGHCSGAPGILVLTLLSWTGDAPSNGEEYLQTCNVNILELATALFKPLTCTLHHTTYSWSNDKIIFFVGWGLQHFSGNPEQKTAWWMDELVQ